MTARRPPEVDQLGVPTGAPDAQHCARRVQEPGGFGRLLTVDQAAEYIGASVWLVRQYLIAGDLAVTRLPRPRTASALRSGARRPSGDAVRRTLIDRLVLDEFIDSRCQREHGAPSAFPTERKEPRQ